MDTMSVFKLAEGFFMRTFKVFMSPESIFMRSFRVVKLVEDIFMRTIGVFNSPEDIFMPTFRVVIPVLNDNICVFDDSALVFLSFILKTDVFMFINKNVIRMVCDIMWSRPNFLCKISEIKKPHFYEERLFSFE